MAPPAIPARARRGILPLEADGRPRMKKTELEAAARDAFLADRRLGILTLHGESGAPIARPLWYGWNGREVEMISASRSPRVLRLAKDPRASVLVTNIPPEPACWVALEGRVKIDPASGQEAAARLARRYLIDAHVVAATLEVVRGADLVRLSMVPDRIRSFTERMMRDAAAELS